MREIAFPKKGLVSSKPATSGNPVLVRARDFLYSLANIESLEKLSCSHCQSDGSITVDGPVEYYDFAFDGDSGAWFEGAAGLRALFPNPAEL